MPIPLYRRRYCNLFRATEEQLGFRPTVDNKVSTPVQQIRPSDRPTPLVTDDPREVADEVYLQSIREHIREIVALDNRFGGGDLVRLSTRFFRSLHSRLSAGAFHPNIERDLYASAGELAEVIGWLAYDAEQHDLARRMNQESLYFTRLAGDRAVELLTLQNASMHAGAMGRPREALRIAQSVLESDDRLSPRLRALFLTRKARALAQGGDASSLRIFQEARSLYLEGVSERDPSWAWWIDDREMAWHEAMALRDLGKFNEALPLFERSVEATPSTETRSQYLHRAYLLQAQIDVALWRDVDETIRGLAPLAEEVASTRTAVLIGRSAESLRFRKRVPVATADAIEDLGRTLEDGFT